MTGQKGRKAEVKWKQRFPEMSHATLQSIHKLKSILLTRKDDLIFRQVYVAECQSSDLWIDDKHPVSLEQRPNSHAYFIQLRALSKYKQGPKTLVTDGWNVWIMTSRTKVIHSPLSGWTGVDFEPLTDRTNLEGQPCLDVGGTFPYRF